MLCEANFHAKIIICWNVVTVNIYLIWCEENSLLPLKSRSFSDGMVANLKKYQLEHSNNIINSAGRRVWGFVGIEAEEGFDKREIYDNSQRTYIHRK